MGFLGFGTPTWKHRDAEVRLRAVQALDEGKQSIFRELALGDNEPRVRAAATRRVDDLKVLQELVKSGDEAVRRIAGERLSGAAEQQLMAKPHAECAFLLERIADQKSLGELAIRARDVAVRQAALTRLLAQEDPSAAVLETIAIQDADGQVGPLAVARLERRSTLRTIAKKAKHQASRAAAATRAEQASEEPVRVTAEQTRIARRAALQPVLERALRLAVTADLERAQAEWPSVEVAWNQALALAGNEPLDEAAAALQTRFTRSQQELAARVDSERARRGAVVAAREAVVAELESQAQADDLVAARAAWLARWRALEAVPAELATAFQARFDLALERVAPLPVVPEIPVPDALIELNAKAEALADGVADLDTAHHFHVLHKTWMSVSAVLPDGHPARLAFPAAYARYKARRQEDRLARQQQREDRTGAMDALVVEAEALATAGQALTEASDPATLTAHERTLTAAQARWRAIGPVRADQLGTRRDRFRAAIDAAYAPVRHLREARDWDRFAHVAKAENLIAGATALAEVTDLGQLAGEVKRLQAEWKKLGPLPREKQQPLWEAFHAACEAQFVRCQPWFAEQDALRAANLARKQALLAEARTLLDQGTVGLAGSVADREHKRRAVDRMKGIQQEWRAVGPVPREADQEIWRQFREVADGFFSRHKADLAVRDQEQVANLDAKQRICESIEQLAQAAEAEKAQPRGLVTANQVQRRLQEVQFDWRRVGFVPRTDIDAINARFNVACDRAWAAISDYTDGLKAEREEGLRRREAMLTELEELASRENPQWYRDDVKAIQGRWRDAAIMPRAELEPLERRFRDLTRKILNATSTAPADGSVVTTTDPDPSDAARRPG